VAAPRAVGVVLAAGKSERAGFPKALAEIDGETLIARAVRNLADAGVGDVVVVLGPPHGAAIARALGGVAHAENPAPERGMLSSLAVGLRAAFDAWPEAEVALFSLVDHPRVRPATVAELLATWSQKRVPALRPTHAGHGGHPVVLSRATAERLLAASHERTIRDVIVDAGGLADHEVDDAGVSEDADTLDALLRLGAHPPKSG
jgi:CTP:molybdopterin cytidylyltransferase MocA